jgi:hypothetical protein
MPAHPPNEMSDSVVVHDVPLEEITLFTLFGSNALSGSGPSRFCLGPIYVCKSLYHTTKKTIDRFIMHISDEKAFGNDSQQVRIKNHFPLNVFNFYYNHR